MPWIEAPYNGTRPELKAWGSVQPASGSYNASVSALPTVAETEAMFSLHPPKNEQPLPVDRSPGRGFSSGESGIRTRGTPIGVHRFSKPAPSAARPSLQSAFRDARRGGAFPGAVGRLSDPSPPRSTRRSRSRRIHPGVPITSMGNAKKRQTDCSSVRRWLGGIQTRCGASSLGCVAHPPSGVALSLRSGRRWRWHAAPQPVRRHRGCDQSAPSFRSPSLA